MYSSIHFWALQIRSTKGLFSLFSQADMSNFMHHRWLDEAASELKRSSNSTNVFVESFSILHNTICCGHWSQVHTPIVLLSTLNHDSFVKSQTPFTQLAYAYTHTYEKGIK